MAREYPAPGAYQCPPWSWILTAQPDEPNPGLSRRNRFQRLHVRVPRNCTGAVRW